MDTLGTRTLSFIEDVSLIEWFVERIVIIFGTNKSVYYKESELY